MLFRQLIEHYRKYLITIDRSNETVRGYTVELSCLNRFLEEKYNGMIYFDELTIEDYEDYLLYLKNKGFASASRRRMIYIIRSLYNFCVKKDILVCNLGIKLDAICSTQKERDYLTNEEFDELIEVIENPLIRLTVITLFYTGLRIKECLNLKIEDIDFKNLTIHVKNTKSKKDRKIPLHQNLVVLLKDYLNNWYEGGDSEYIFATKKTGRLSPGYVNWGLHRATKTLGWKRHITCHNLRHSFASNLVKRKIDLVKIQKLLGHSSLKVTGIYTHVDDSELHDAVNCI